MKFFYWLVKMTAMTLLVSMITLVATWTAVQTYLNKILSHYQLSETVGKPEFSDFLSSLSDQVNILKEPSEKNIASTGTTAGGLADPWSPPANGQESDTQSDSSPEPTLPEGSPQAPETENSGANEQQDSVEGDKPSAPDAVPVWNQVSSSEIGGGSAAQDAEKKLIVSTEEFQKKKDQISPEDKLTLFSLVVSKLPSSEVQTLSRLIEDGISSDELNEMDTILKKYLSKEDYNKVIEIISKY